MATLVTGPTIFSQATDADYRIAIAAYKDLLTAVNPSILTQTADTGQVDVTTVVRPAINTRPDYLMFKFNDGLGPAIYFKLCFGCASSNTAPSMHVEFGRATDGAGNITTEKVVGDPTGWVGAASSQAYNYACCIPGALSVTMGQNGLSPTQHTRTSIYLCRFSDDAGNWASSGALAMTVAYDYRTQAHNLKFGSGRTFFADSNQPTFNCYMPFGRTTLTLAGVLQPQAVHYVDQGAESALGIVLVTSAETPSNVEFDLAVRGTTPRRYKVLQGGGGPAYQTTAFAVLWE